MGGYLETTASMWPDGVQWEQEWRAADYFPPVSLTLDKIYITRDFYTVCAYTNGTTNDGQAVPEPISFFEGLPLPELRGTSKPLPDALRDMDAIELQPDLLESSGTWRIYFHSGHGEPHWLESHFNTVLGYFYLLTERPAGGAS